MAAGFVELLLAALQTKERHGPDAAIPQLAQAAALAQPDHYCHELLVAWLREAGRGAEACAVLERQVARAPTAATRLALAHLLHDECELVRALDQARAVLAEAPDHAEAARLVAAVEAAIEDAAGRLDHFLGPLTVEHRYPAPFVGFTGRPGGLHADGNALNGQRLDAWGFPNAALPSLPKPADETRVFVLGDSTMFNGATLADTVPALLEGALRRAGAPTARVYNFSVVSASAMQMVALLLHRLADCRPDLVVVVNGGIDFMNPREYDPRPGYPFNFFMIEELYANAFDPLRGGPIGTREAFIRRAAAHQLKLRRQVGWDSAAWEDAVVAAWLESVDRLGTVAVGTGLDVALVLEPMAAARGRPSAEELGYLRPQTLDYYRRQYRCARAGLAAPARPRPPALSVHDGDDAFAGEPGTVFKDWIHFNGAGRRLMTAYLAAVVRDRLAARG
jgi:hypothetical protein